MDWYLDGDDPRSAALLRHEVMQYLQRHADPDSSLADAQLVVAEMLGNAVKHAGGPVWVSLSWRESSPLLSVRDLGPGFDPALLVESLEDFGDLVSLESEDDVPAEALAEGGRGLFLISHLAPGLASATRGHTRGAQVSAMLPVVRRRATSHDPMPRLTSSALPELDEAEPEGAFGRESFLRALVVQLAQTVELQQGPDAADAAVAQVGTDIGGQMEEEYRLALEVVGRLTPDQMAHAYVRLKHAIDGGFYVIEADQRRIILGNRSCPFGDVVKHAPSLCRITSSVFGGIAARNSDTDAYVLLEERIAVGDDGCRVVVYLDDPPDEQRPFSHRYAARPPDDGVPAAE